MNLSNVWQKKNWMLHLPTHIGSETTWTRELDDYPFCHFYRFLFHFSYCKNKNNFHREILCFEIKEMKFSSGREHRWRNCEKKKQTLWIEWKIGQENKIYCFFYDITCIECFSFLLFGIFFFFFILFVCSNEEFRFILLFFIIIFFVLFFSSSRHEWSIYSFI